MLEKKFHLTYLSGGSGSMVSSALLLDTDTPEPDFLYISGSPEDLRRIKKPVSCSFLLTGPVAEHDIPESLRGLDIACVTEPAPVVKVLQDVFALIMSLVNWDTRLHKACLDGAEYTAQFNIIQELFTIPFILHDRNFRTIAYTDDFFDFINAPNADWEYIPTEMVNEIIMVEEDEYKIFKHREPYIYPQYPCKERWLCRNIFNGPDLSGNHYEGRLVAAYDQSSPNINGQLELLALCGDYLGVVFISKSGKLLDKKQEDAFHELMRSYILQSKDIAEQDILPIIKGEDWQIQDLYRVAVFHIPDTLDFSNRSSYLCRQLESDLIHSCAVIMAPFIIWIINDRFQGDPRNKFGNYQKIIPYFIREFNCKAGISNRMDSFMCLKDGYTQANAALRLGEKKDPHLWRYNFADYTMDYISERLTGELSLEGILHSGILALIKYDKENGTEYLKTTRYFANARYNMTIAAANLPVHRLTFLRRLEKIKEISGIDFDDPDELLHVHLSIKLLSLDYKL
ncbi:MAG: helix-turn-helix domain-containing protein [Treponema sp.]|nr:helix-turn-helix domain-containing protein [Treponema sp.]